MKEYDIFVPLFYNDGKPIEAAKFQELQEVLLDRFEGLTFFPQPNKGFWKMAGVTAFRYACATMFTRSSVGSGLITRDDNRRFALRTARNRELQ